MVNYDLSKSQFCKGRSCTRRVWLYNYQPEVASDQSAFQDMVFAQGNEVTALARKHFAGGVLIDEDQRQPDRALEHTGAAMSSGKEPVFEAAFLYDGVFIRADILCPTGDGAWNLIEVKSTTSIKEEHRYDLAVQKFVLTGLKIPLNGVSLMFLNRYYVRGSELDLDQLFKIEPLADTMEEYLEQVPRYLSTIRSALSRAEMPEAALGTVCKNPYQCEFTGLCWDGLPEDSIHYLYRITDDKRRELEGQGILRTVDIPAKFKLSAGQKVQVDCEKAGQCLINREQIAGHLSQLRYPLHSLDFEAVGYAIPQYPGTQPYQQLPFQFSLHIQESPGANLIHQEYIHLERSDPRAALAAALCSAVQKEGSVIAYHASYEQTCLKDLQTAAPDLHEQLESIIDRLWDLEIPFARKWFYDPRFHGSSSIKKVLPVLVPDLTYDGMAVAKGDQAQAEYLRLLGIDGDDSFRDEIAGNLLKYCELDSLAMSRILVHLQNSMHSQ